MAKKKTVADQSRSGHVSSFTGGLNTDLHPMLQPNDTLTDCVNGTLITYNGNENMLQNDMGNYELKHAQLPEGYIPMGMKEHQGILYIASWNPFEKRAQIGSYPSPKTVFGEENGNEYTISPIEIGEINTEDLSDPQLAELIFNIAEKNTKDLPKGVDPSKHLVRDIDFSQTEKVFTDNFDENTKLGAGDRYWLSTAESDSYEDDFQKLEYFLIDEDKNKYDITNSIVCNKQEKDSLNADDFTPVTFDHSGWLGARYILKDIYVPDIDVTINENAFTSENYLQNVTEVSDDGSTGSLEDLQELWYPGVPAHQVSDFIHNTEKKDVYPQQPINESEPQFEVTDRFWQNNPIYDKYIYVHCIVQISSNLNENYERWITNYKGQCSIVYKLTEDKFISLESIDSLISANVRMSSFNVYFSRNIRFINLHKFKDYTINNLVCTESIEGCEFENAVVENVWCIKASEHVFDWYKNNNNIDFTIRVLDSEDRCFILIGGSAEFDEKNKKPFSSFEIVYDRIPTGLGLADHLIHLEVFGNKLFNTTVIAGLLKEGCVAYLNSPVSVIEIANGESTPITVIPNTEHLISIHNTGLLNVVIDHGKRSYREIILTGNVKNAWIKGDISFRNNHPENTYSSNTCVVNNTQLILTQNNTVVNQIVSEENGSVIIPEGIKILRNKCLTNNLETLVLPSTIDSIGGIKMSGVYESSYLTPNINKLVINSNYRHDPLRSSFTANNIYVTPNNLHYYCTNKPFYTTNTEYFSKYAFDTQNDVEKTYELEIKSNTEYNLIQTIFDSIDTPHIITPAGKNINLVQYSINDGVVTADYNKFIDTLSSSDLPKNLSFTEARINMDCVIEKGVIQREQKWFVTKNTSVDLSHLISGDSVTITIINAENENDVTRFISSIIFPDIEPEALGITVNINSSVKSVTSDFYKNGISLNIQTVSLDKYVKSNTIEFKPSSEKWTYCNIVESFNGEINTYSLSFGYFGSEPDYETAFNVILENHKSIIKESILVIPQNTYLWQSVVNSHFGNVITYENIDTANKTLANVVLEGSEMMGYYKYDWNLSDLEIQGCFKITVNLLGKESDFGVKLRTPLFRYEDGKLKVKDFYASVHNILSKDVINSEPTANIIINTDSLQDGCRVAVRVKNDSGEKKYYVLSNTLLSVPDEITKSNSYTVDSYVFKQSNNQILIENLNAGSININKNSIVDDLSIYRYGKHGNKLRIQLEWPQAIDQTECYWTISDLNNNIVIQGEILENMYFDSIDLDVDLAKLDGYWYVFSYYTPNKIYRRPLFAKTKITYTDETFDGPNYSDYKNAYYEDFVNSEKPTIDYKVEDSSLRFSEMQIWHKKQNDHFTWDSQYSKESPKALWWELMDEFDNNYKYYLGTRKYQTVTLDLEKFGFVKGVTEYSVELHADGYDKPHILQKSGIYDVENNINVFTIPIGESIQQVESTNEKAFPFKKEYLIQNSYAPTEFDYESILGENTKKVLRVCDWDKGKMLCVDKTSGETNDCSIALLDPKEYNPDSDSFKNGKIISGEGNFVSKILSKVDNLFVPIVVRIKTDDNGFVFPVIQNPNWSYKATWDEARGKKNSDNKRSVWSSNGLGAITHTKNNLAAAHANLWAGIGQLAVVIATWIAAAVLSVVSLGLAAPVVATLAVLETATIGVTGATQLGLGIAEFKKKEKVFKLFALRGKSNKGGQQKDLLLLPLWGKQEEHDSKNFEGQARYENADWSIAEKLMLYLGSRIYAKVYSDERYIPKFVGDEINKGFKLVVNFKNINIKSGGISLQSLEKMFEENYGIVTKNFTLKVSEISHVDIDFYKDRNVDIVNNWLGKDSYSSLTYQLTNWKDANKFNINQPIIDLGTGVNQKISNFANCLNFDPLTKCFYYDEIDTETLYEEDPRWAFGPNRGGCRMRIKRNFRKKNGNKSKDKDWIDVGEFPRFNNDVITPIAYPILPYCNYSDGRNENIVNSYNAGAGNPVYIETLDLNIEKPEDIITKDCMNYLEYIYYDKIKKLQTTDSTN